MQQQVSEAKLCPKCRRVLAEGTPGLNADPGSYWFCDTCDEYFTDEDFAVPQQDVRRCKFCQHVLEYDHHVRDDFKWWCSICNATFNDSGKAQPGQRIWYTVPEVAACPHCNATEPIFHDGCCEANRKDRERANALEAVAASAIAVFVRNGADLVYMPGSKSRNDLQQAVENLLASGWRPK